MVRSIVLVVIKSVFVKIGLMMFDWLIYLFVIGDIMMFILDINSINRLFVWIERCILFWK